MQMYFLGVGTLRSCVGAFPGKKGGMQGLGSLAPSSKTIGFLLETLGSKADLKID
jgi:hypothetical protein